MLYYNVYLVYVVGLFIKTVCLFGADILSDSNSYPIRIDIDIDPNIFII